MTPKATSTKTAKATKTPKTPKAAKKTSRKQEIAEKLAEQALKIEIAEQAAQIEAGTSVETTPPQADPIALTDDELSAVRAAVHATYEAIASDAGLRENARPAEILEVVLDADRVHNYGRLSTELYGKFDAWVQQELKAAMSMGAGLRKLVPLIWEAKAPKASRKPKAAEVNDDAAKAAADYAREAAAARVEGAELPVDPKAPAGATLKTCPICNSVRIPKTWRFCNACWDVKKAARAAAKKGAAAVNGTKEDRPTVN